MKVFYSLTFCFIIFLGIITAQQKAGISGTIKNISDDQPIPHANVLIKGTLLGVASDEAGKYKLNNLDAGTYLVAVSVIGFKSEEREITIKTGEQAVLDFFLQQSSYEVGEITVFGASRKRERITEAPASISVLDADEIKRNSGHGQIVKLLEMQPGVDIVQSGLFDFNINTRGFNSSLNRRLLILLDGRDLGTAFLGATEWNGLSIPLEELGRVELVRGPGSALYGANAYNGVINITSLDPKADPGTRIAVSGGERSSFRGDIKYAGIYNHLSYRINLGGYQGKSFSTSRKNNNFEYEGLQFALNNEVIDLNTDPIRSVYGNARVDYDFDDGSTTSLEAGLTQVENETIVTGIGRVQIQKANRPYGRFNYNGHGFNVLLWANGRFNEEPEKSLSTGLDLIQDALISHGEVQYNFKTLNDNLNVVVGASHRIVRIDTDGTLMLEKRNDNTSGLFTQLEYKISKNLKAVGAARWDRSTLHDSRLSPKLALVWNPYSNHSFRATFNQAFQPANYSEQYLYVKRPTTTKSSILYQGNPNLKPEEIQGYELGYKGVLANKFFVTVDLFFNQLKEFITDLGPTGGSIVDSKNTADPNDDIVYSVWTYNNAGEVQEYGSEFSLNYYLSDSWLLTTNFTLYKFDVISREINDILLPNTPEYKFNGGIIYTHPAGHTAEIGFKYVPSYPWASGIYRGADIKSYSIVNVSGTYRLTSYLSLNLNVANALDNNHYEILGGSLLGRRAILTAIAEF